ncbi:inactive peptidyl-prolyl cis-trans isomerase shutdown [Anopheles maculipalpis]|uniref:inactive peptidyl-prolyl cis-trans isomerase shutdown n=1 Tax=Anopheles maculipalpis TaxID=1496333 RepID=UPI0021593F06|nr:inactive peptidyl-prolyl cis-trans isomerase shutdown [Anopheles maculipalpis]
MNSGNMLKTPINMSDLLHGGTEFQIDTDFKYDEGDDNFIEDDYGSADEDEEKHKQLFSPWDRTFDELRQKMEPISEHIYKRITKAGVGEELPDNTQVKVDYNVFFEMDVKPADSSTLRGKPFRFVLGAHNVLLGFEQAVKTMRVSEEAQFVISYQLLYGVVGCPPRIKPKADALFVIRLISASPVNDGDALAQLNETERRSYSAVKEKVAQARQYAKDCFKRNLVQKAIAKYLEAVDTLQMCQLKDETEQEEQQKTLIALYTSLAVCYNHRDQPKDACRMVNMLRTLCNVKQNAKIMYQEGKALMKIGDYDRARKCLLGAQKLEPQDENIQRTLKELNECSARHQQEEKRIWTRAFGLVDATKKDDKTKEADNVLAEDIKRSMKVFLEDETCSTLTLPDRFTEKEVQVIEKLADEFNLKLVIHMHNNKKHYKFQK